MNTYKNFTLVGFSLIVAALLTFGVVLEAAAQDGDALAIMNDSHKTYYYAGDGGHAKVSMVLTDKKGRTREREFWMVRRDVEDMGDQRYFTYFLKPADVSRTGFLVHKNAEGSDSRWLYIPSLDLVKRIAANDSGSSFVGSDFAYEDVSGRLPIMDNHEILGEDTVNDRTVLKIKNTPKEAKTADYAYRISYIDKENHLPLKEEYFDKKDRLARVFDALTVEDVEGFPTATKRRMTNTRKGSFTVLTFTDMTYVATLDADAFSERMLKNPPRKYTR
jgi:outer membrane lipoprotein-sorting protein